MGDVSNYSTSEYDSEMKSIMDGGANWAARMTMLLKTKEAAQAAVASAQIVGDIKAKQTEIVADRAAAKKELAEAKDFADGIVAKASEQADEMLAKAKKDAAEMVASAKAKLAEANEKAAKISDAANAHMAEADDVMKKAKAFEAELASKAADLGVQSDKLADALNTAETMKVRCKALAVRLRAAMAEFPDVA